MHIVTTVTMLTNIESLFFNLNGSNSDGASENGNGFIVGDNSSVITTTIAMFHQNNFFTNMPILDSLIDINITATTNDSFYASNLSYSSSVGSVGGRGGSFVNGVSSNTDEMEKRDFVFDRIDVRIIFITLYSMVFCCCFFVFMLPFTFALYHWVTKENFILGNLLVILVVTMSRRLRSITNFFLANLAVADFCVGVFCVMQNLTIYLIDSWVFGEFLCKMYQFVHSLSYTASIFILVVICMERYFAIIHPITCKQILTPTRLRLVIGGVWITSAIYSTPKFIFSRTITNVHTSNGMNEEICIMHRKLFNSKLLDFINFALLYVLPLLVMTVLYSRIAVALWKSSQGFDRGIAMHNTSSSIPSTTSATAAAATAAAVTATAQQPTITPTTLGSNHLHYHHHNNHNHSHHLNHHVHHHHPHHSVMQRSCSKYEKRPVGVTDSQVSVDSDKVVVTTWRTQSFHHQRHGNHHQMTQMTHSSSNVLRARRGVIRMLIIVVLTFALCNLPYHARKMWQYWSHTYRGDSNFNALFTPLTFLVTYFNSGINPLLYAFLSRNFRKGMRELLLCAFKKSKSKSIQQRIPLHNHSLPTDTTHVGNHL